MSENMPNTAMATTGTIMAGTRNTTRTRRRSGSGRTRRVLWPALAAVLACGLSVAAAARFAAALCETGSSPIQAAFDDGRTGPGEDLAKWTRDLATRALDLGDAAAWRGPGRTDTDRG